jgi:hypothetical protein
MGVEVGRSHPLTSREQVASRFDAMAQTAIIDGSNLTATPDGEHSLARLEAAAAQVADLMGADWRTRLRVVVDASLRHRLTPTDRGRLEHLVETGHVEQAPAGVDADVFILQWANDHDALVISNDLFRPYASQYPWLSSAGRCVTANYDRLSSRWMFFERNAGGRPPRSLSDLLGSLGSAEQSLRTSTQAQAAPPNWYADPTGRFELRYWNGTAWSEHVATNGVQSEDRI